MHEVNSVNKHSVFAAVDLLVELAKLIKLLLSVEVLDLEVEGEPVNEPVVLFNEQVPVGQVAGSKSNAERLAGVGRADSASRGSNDLITSRLLEFLFTQTIGFDLDLGNQVSSGRDFQTTLVVDTVGVKLGELVEHAWDVNDDAIAKNVLALGVKDSARK